MKRLFCGNWRHGLLIGVPTASGYGGAMVGRVLIEDMPPVEKGRASDLDGPETVRNGDQLTASALPEIVFDAILHPNRSLPDKGFALVMAVVIAANMVFGTFFFAVGAWPVIGFCGLDIFLVWLAFKISYRQGRLHERVCLTQDWLMVSRVLPSGHETRWRLQPFWTRVHIDRPVRHESQLQLRSKGRTLVIGSFLSPPERAELGHALARALERASWPGTQAQ